MALTLLLVEDNPINAYFAAREVEALGFEAFSVESGREALRVLSERTFDVVLLDRGLPDMDGLLVAALLGSGDKPAHSGRTTFFAMTGESDRPEDKELRAAGVRAALRKPLRGAELAERLFEDLSRSENEERPEI